MLGQTTLTLFRSLPADVMAKLAMAGKLHLYADAQLISSRGDCDRELNIVESGAVRVSNVDLDGRRTETATLEIGDSYGEFTLLAGTPRFFDFHAKGETCIRTITKAQFDKLMQDNAAFRDGVLTMLTHRLLTAVGIIEDMRRLPLAAQLAKFLYHCCEKQADGAWQYSGTQSELADAFGVSRVSIGHALKTLQQDDLLSTGYRCVNIKNKTALQLWLIKRSSLLPV